MDFQEYASEILRGEKIRLRPLQEDDLPRLAAWWNDPAWMVLQQAAIFPTPEASTIEMFRNWSGNDNPRGFGFSIEDIESGNGLSAIKRVSSGVLRGVTFCVCGFRDLYCVSLGFAG